MNNKIILILFNIGILILILETSHTWMFWNMGTSFKALMYIAIFVVGLKLFQNQKKQCVMNDYFMLAPVFLFLANVLKTGSSFLGMVEVLIYIMIMWIVLVLPLEQKKVILCFQTKILALLLLVSLAFWVVHYFYPMPYTEIQRPGFEHLPSAHNYYFFITTYMGLLDYRFHSIFLEPGHLGCIISFLVIANQFNFKNKYVLILSIVLLFTLSLAGYVIYFMGFLLYSLNQNKRTRVFKMLSIGCLIFLNIWLFGSYYNDGDNYVNERINERLQYDDETGELAGDNRYTEEMERKFEKTIYSIDLFLGIPTSEYRLFRVNAGNGAGIKLWIIQKGIFGTLLLFLGYYFIASGSKNRRWAMLMLLIYAISSYQRMYFFWASYLIPFICGSAIPINNQIRKLVK